MKKSFCFSGVALLALCLVPMRALAVPITGDIDLSGTATLNSTSLGTATGVTSFSNVVVNDVTAGSALDAFINAGDAVTMTAPWSFNSGISALWSVGGFTLDLISSSAESQTATFLYVHGFGTLSGNSFDPTPGEFFLTSQGHGDGYKFAFSSTTEDPPATTVPDGGATALLMLGGIAGLGLIRRLGLNMPGLC